MTATKIESGRAPSAYVLKVSHRELLILSFALAYFIPGPALPIPSEDVWDEAAELKRVLHPFACGEGE